MANNRTGARQPSKTTTVQKHSAKGFDALHQSFLAYVGDHQNALSVAALSDGVIVHGGGGFKTARSLKNIRHLAIDCERYLGDRISPPPQLFRDPPKRVVQEQITNGATFLLADSRFAADQSAASIDETLRYGEQFVNAAQEVAPDVAAFVTTVIRFDQLAERDWTAPARASGLPIATVFASRGDPFADRRALEGALELVQSPSAVLVMRCDLSAIGLVALGAHAASIGASSSVRHLYLPTKRGKAPTGSGYVFVPALAAWVKARFIESAMAETDIDHLMSCSCSVCGPTGDIRRLVLPGATSMHRELHSIASTVSIGRSVLSSGSPISAWRKVCLRALDGYAQLAELGIAGPTTPPMLRNWAELC